MRACVYWRISTPSSGGPGPVHGQWWQQYLRGRRYRLLARDLLPGGQIESVYIDMPGTGLARFAPVTPARGSLFSARRRLGMREGSEPPPGIPEEELYQQ